MKEPSLDLAGIAEGTDKNSLQHDYLRHYERIFGPWRDEPIDLLEIGVASGASVRTWRRWFTRARIIGVDINPGCRQHATDGIIIEIGSADDPAFLIELCRRYRPSIIIDDGSHLADHIQFAFEHLFPALEPGGWYVIEDFVFHFGEDEARHRGNAARSMSDYALQLPLWLLDAGRRLPLSTADARTRDAIDSIEVARGLLAIKKKALLAPDLAAMDAALRESRSATSLALFAGRLIDAGRLDSAEAVSRRAIEAQPDDWLPYAKLAEVLERRGNLGEALAAVTRSVAVVRGEREKAMMREREMRLRSRVG